MDITEALRKIGLNERETVVYSDIVLRGSVTMQDLARSTGIPRTTVYRICESFAERGLIRYKERNGEKTIMARPDDFLVNNLKERQFKLKDKTEALGHLGRIFPGIASVPGETEVRYYRGVSGMQQLLWNTLRAKGRIFGYSSGDRHKYLDRSFLEEYQEECVKRKIEDHSLMNLESYEDTRWFYSHMSGSGYVVSRFIGKDELEISGDTYIYNDIFAVNFADEDEIFGVEVENSENVKLQKSLFNMMWKLAVPYEDLAQKRKR